MPSHGITFSDVVMPIQKGYRRNGIGPEDGSGKDQVYGKFSPVCVELKARTLERHK